MKQAIIIRTDLKMGKGKIASQCAHASIAAFLKSKVKEREEWINEGMKKIILKASSEKELMNLFNSAKKEKLPSELIYDAGLTQIEPGSVTALGIGPADDSKIDKITGKLKLL
jgi:PTH2 family peptidyl-tRNA hydrolase